MHIKRLALAFAIVTVLLVASVVAATPENLTSPAVASAPAAPSGFDQAAVLKKLWESPDSAVVATVNGDKITKGELTRMLWEWNAPAALDELITQKMIRQAATAAEVTVTPAEIEAKIQEQATKIPGVQNGDWKTAIRQHGMTESRFRDSIEVSTLVEKTVQKDVKITEAQFAEWVKASHVLVRPDQQAEDPEKADADAKARAEKVFADLKAGKNFADIAREVSEDPGSKELGGDLGWFKRGRMVKEFDDAIFGSGENAAMKAGEISKVPVKSMFGYHIILLEKVGGDASAEEKAELREQILGDTVPTKMRDWFNNLKAAAVTDNLLSPPMPTPQMGPAPPPPAPPH